MDILSDLLRREGGFTNNPYDAGGPTNMGITLRTLSQWRKAPVTVEDLKALTPEEAKAIYSAKYLVGPGFDRLPPGMLQSQLVDFGVNSGPGVAILNLQEVLGVPATGTLDNPTLLALQHSSESLVNLALCKRRLMLFARLCKKDPKQVVFLQGWVKRALEFI